MKTKDLEWAAVAAAWSAGSFNCFLPNSYELKREVCVGTHQEIRGKLKDAREGYWTAIAQSLLVGGLISLAAETPLPIVAAVATDAVMMWSYERAIPPAHRLLRGGQRVLTIPDDSTVIDGDYRVIEADR